MSGYVQGEDGVWREPPGYAALWLWFGLSRASWLTLPRVLMHEMPDDWQARMAQLLEEYDAAWNIPESMQCETMVSAKRNGKFVRLPSVLLTYRHPRKDEIDRLRAKP